jgi:hypothetical protein
MLRDSHGPSTESVFRIVHRVLDVLIQLKTELIRWPEDCRKVAAQFYSIAGFPMTIGALDGTHVRVSPPLEDEAQFVNRHHQHSINVLAVAGPDLTIFYVTANSVGR